MRRLLLRTRLALLPPIVSALLLATANSARAQQRVETGVALSHLISKVEAVVPDEARAKKIGGPVIADVTIGARGNVFSLTILSGPELLRPEAERALRQWVFKPFTVDGKPDSVRTILEIDFPDPVKEGQDRHLEDFRVAVYQCKRQMELDASNAEAVCAAAVASAELLPADLVLDRCTALTDHAQALLAGGRPTDAAFELERVIEMRHRVARGADATTANVQMDLAILYERLGEKGKADAQCKAAIAEYTAALERSPGSRRTDALRLQSSLTRYAAFKRANGDPAAAAELESRAAAVTIPDRPAATTPDPAVWLPPAPAVTRTVGGVEINEAEDGRLSDDDLGSIRAALATTGKKPWRLEARVRYMPGTDTDRSPTVYAFFPPDVVTTMFRRGDAADVAKLPVSAAKNAPRAWTVPKARLEYIQLAQGSGDATSESPIPVWQADEPAALTDEELIFIVKLIRGSAVPKPTDKYLSDVQPWPIRDISAFAYGVHVMLTDPAAREHQQLIRLRKTSGQWAVVELMEAGWRPHK